MSLKKLAVKNNHLSYVNMLLENGADPNAKEDYSVGSETPIIKAVELNSYEVNSKSRRLLNCS